MVKFLRVAAALLAFIPALALGQAQIPSGTFWANPGASKAPPTQASVTAIFDRALGSTRGSLIERGASGWGVIGPSATAGLPFVSAGAGADPLYQIVGVVGGGTGLNTYAIGDILTASAVTTLARIADVATGSVLKSGGVGVIPAWGKVTSSELNITTTSCTNQFLTAISAAAGGTCTTVTLTGAQFANQGTTTTVLHGNAAGNPTFAGISFADLVSTEVASAAQYLAGTANKIVQSGVIYQAETTTTFGATTAFDFATFINTRVTLTANITTMNVSNVTAGKAGHIVFKQSGAGSFTTVFNSIFKFAGGTTPSLTTGSTTAEDVLFYDCTSATTCYASLNKDMK
jgi:hypothetical protein